MTSPLTFVEKTIELKITLGEGDFGDTIGDTVTLSGLRMMVEATNPGGESMGQAHITVHGMAFDMMNKLTTIGQVNRAIRTKNSVVITAGDKGGTLNTVFEGTIFDAWGDYNRAPDVAFDIIAYAGMDSAVTPAEPLSFKGSADVGGIMQQLAQSMGLAFENNGVEVQLSNPYLSGSLLAQVKSCARAADIRYIIDRGTLAIWPKTGGRDSEIPLISPDTGMVGYPALSSKGMSVQMIYNPNVTFGGDVEVKSSIPMACGKFRVFNLAHTLACLTPSGPWFTYMDCYNVGEQ